MSLTEDSYGRLKRLAFVSETIEALKPRRVLDIGCGTGSQLTRPLAERFPTLEIVGTDADTPSLDVARAQPPVGRLRFVDADRLDPAERFDLVIASEVLEHVEEPAPFLDMLVARLERGGRLLVTVPNGYGPFETMSLVEVTLNLSGLQRVLRWIKHGGRRSRPAGTEESRDAVTLAVSPHVNFFSQRDLADLFAAAGLEPVRFRSRTVFCGYLIDSLVRRPDIVHWNARLADRLPAWCASDWMIELKPAGQRRPVGWRRGAWARWRRGLNRRRWQMA